MRRLAFTNIKSDVEHFRLFSNKSKVMTTNSNLDNCRFVNQQEIASGKWLSLNKIIYTDHKGNERQWEAIYRTTRQSGSADAVVVIPVLKRLLKYDCLVFVKQYRPPLKCCTIEFPAGLIDKGESPDESALRELKEETGYTGNPKHVSPITCLDSGTGNCSINMVTVEIDGDDPINKDVSPKPASRIPFELSGSRVMLCYYVTHHWKGLSEPFPMVCHITLTNNCKECLEVLLIPMEQLIEKLNDLSKEGHVIDSRCYAYAIGIEQTRKYLKKITQP